MGLSARQWELLKLIPNYEKGKITTTLLIKLLVKDFKSKEITSLSFRKSIQRDLRQLYEVIGKDFDLDETEKEFKVSWAKNAPALRISGLSIDEVIAFGVLQKQGTYLLPKHRWDAMSGFFQAASLEAETIVLEQGASIARSKLQAKNWLDKIHHLPETLSFIRPKIKPEIEKVIHEALLIESLVEIFYDNKDSIVVQPQAIVQQGVRSYLIANSRGKSGTLKYYLIHKIIKAKITLGDYFPVSSQSITNQLKRGIAYSDLDESLIGQEIDIKLWVDANSQWLKETKLSENQSTEDDYLGKEKNGLKPFYLFVTIELTENLIRWILSMGAHVKVISPDYVKKRIVKNINLIHKLYD
jgi:predicted DNA-binding transcriptional regulator YafY